MGRRMSRRVGETRSRTLGQEGVILSARGNGARTYPAPPELAGKKDMGVSDVPGCPPVWVPPSTRSDWAQ